VVQYFNYPLFTFHPATDRIVWGYEAARSGEGPNMLCTVGPRPPFSSRLHWDHCHDASERVTGKIPLSLVWIFPVLSIPYVIYSLMPWWTLAASH